jgi:hypothetical protein
VNGVCLAGELAACSRWAEPDLETVFATMAEGQAGALMITADPFLSGHAQQPRRARGSARNPGDRPPGGLASYGPSLLASYGPSLAPLQDSADVSAGATVGATTPSTPRRCGHEETTLSLGGSWCRGCTVARSRVLAPAEQSTQAPHGGHRVSANRSRAATILKTQHAAARTSARVWLRFNDGRVMTKKTWASKITAAWQKSVAAIFEAGDLLIAAKDELAHGEFARMIMHELPFSPRTAQSLMAIARDERLRKAHHDALLPPSWRTLDELTRVDDEQFSQGLSRGIINPNMQRSDACNLHRTVFVEDPERVAWLKKGDRFVAGLERGLKHAFGIPDDWQRGAATSSIDDDDIASGQSVAIHLIPALASIHPENYDDALMAILTDLQEDGPKLALIRRAIDEFIPRLRAALDRTP